MLRNGHHNSLTNGDRHLNGNGHAPILVAAPAQAAPESAPPIRLSTVTGILWRRLWVVFLLTFMVAACGWIYVRNATPLYKSTARLFIDRTGPVIVRRTDDPDMLLKTDNFRRTQAEMIKSLNVLTRVANDPTLKDVWKQEGIENPVAYAKLGLETKVGDDDLLYVSFTAKSPNLAARITNAVVEAYVQFINDQRSSTITEVLKTLERVKEGQDSDFSIRLKRLTDYRMANGDIGIGTTASNPIITQLLQYSDALSKARLSLLEAKASLEAAQGLKDNTESLQQFLKSRGEQNQTQEETSRIRRLRDQIEATTKSLQELQEHFTDEYPLARLYQDRITATQNELAQAEEDYRNAVLLAMNQRVELAQSVVTRLEGLVLEQRKVAEQLNTNLARLALLEAEFNQSRQIVDELNSRMKELNISAQTGAMNVEVLEPAIPVAEPSSPNASKVMRVALALGLLIGLMAAFGLEMVDDRLRTAESAAEATGLGTLSVIPATYKTDPRALGLMVNKEPHSPFAEAFRTLRTAIFFGTQEGQRKTILLTSPLPGEGKSTLTANLAQALAQVGRKTILLDCDFRRPRAHEEFKVSNDAGISSIISGQESFEKALHTNICENLDLLTCGPLPPNPSEILNSDAMRTLLESLAARYEHIVIDSPPVLAVADARILAASADVTILVLRADQTRRKAARQACQQLASVGANLLGMVINGAPRSTDRYGYGAGYGAYAYYEDPTFKKAREAKAIAQS